MSFRLNLRLVVVEDVAERPWMSVTGKTWLVVLLFIVLLVRRRGDVVRRSVKLRTSCGVKRSFDHHMLQILIPISINHW